MVLKTTNTRTLQEYLDEFNEVSAAEFMRRHRTPVLILRQHNEGQESAREFQTAVMSRAKINSVQLAMDAQAQVFPLAKRRDAAFTDHISVGRTRSADVCLNFAEVSKFHAYFRSVPGSAGRYTLNDAGATNGTYVNARRLDKSEAVGLENGMVVRFGLCELTYFSADGFCAYVSARARARAHGDSPQQPRRRKAPQL